MVGLKIHYCFLIPKQQRLCYTYFFQQSSSGKSDHSGEKHGCSSSFGSRSSLSGAGGGGGSGMGASTATTGIDSEDSDEDDDMMLTGSRGSLMSARGGGGGSGGLNRWTTEENLSFDGGSREDKMDTLVDGPFLHDSHSNSTGRSIFIARMCCYYFGFQKLYTMWYQ